MNIRNIKWLSVFTLLICGMLVATGIEAKKPEKPSKTETELIEFTGDLTGYAEVEGCCPNAGPFPEYVMTLPADVGVIPADIYYGQLFINRYGAGKDQKYKVQFWTDDFGIEIIGGEIDNDKKNKILTVTFDGAECVDLYTKVYIAFVDFVLIRAPL